MPAPAIAALKASPALKEEFIAKYGQGAFDAVMSAR